MPSMSTVPAATRTGPQGYRSLLNLDLSSPRAGAAPASPLDGGCRYGGDHGDGGAQATKPSAPPLELVPGNRVD